MYVSDFNIPYLFHFRVYQAAWQHVNVSSDPLDHHRHRSRHRPGRCAARAGLETLRVRAG